MAEYQSRYKLGEKGVDDFVGTGRLSTPQQSDVWFYFQLSPGAFSLRKSSLFILHIISLTEVCHPSASRITLNGFSLTQNSSHFSFAVYLSPPVLVILSKQRLLCYLSCHLAKLWLVLLWELCCCSVWQPLLNLHLWVYMPDERLDSETQILQRHLPWRLKVVWSGALLAG